MKQDELETAIKQRWEAGWDAIHPLVPFTYLNESFDASDVWVHLAIEPTVRARTTQGWTNAKYEARGIIRVRLFGSIDVGGSQLARICDEIVGSPGIAGILDETRIGALVYREPSHRLGPSDARWAMRVVTCSYEIEQQR